MNNNRIFYYVQITTGKYTDGNDCLWLGENGSTTYNIDEAKVFDKEQLEYGSLPNEFEIRPVHQILKLIQLHVPITKLRKPKEIQDGELCYLLSKRDKVGTNAGFWAWNHCGYVCDIRNAQIFKYSKTHDRYNREFEYYVPIKTVKKHITQRIDIQDLGKNPPRMASHVLATDYFKEENV